MTTYAPDLKAQVIAEWGAGSSLDRLAKDHGVPKSTVRNWVQGYDRVALVPTAKTELGAYDLDKAAVGLVDDSIRAIHAIYGTAEDPAWLRGQNAADLAILAGVIADKLYRLLGAIRLTDDHGNDEQAQLGP